MCCRDDYWKVTAAKHSVPGNTCCVCHSGGESDEERQLCTCQQQQDAALGSCSASRRCARLSGPDSDGWVSTPFASK